jgi:hypothetical protein
MWVSGHPLTGLPQGAGCPLVHRHHITSKCIANMAPAMALSTVNPNAM